MKNGTEKKTVMYILRVDILNGRPTTVDVLLEPITVQYAEYKIIDIGPDSDRRAEEKSMPISEFQNFVQGSGYISARDYVGMVTDCEKRRKSE